MKIPSETDQKWAFYQDIARKCKASQGPRRRFYSSMRNYYMYGYDASSQFPCKINKMYSHLDTLSSFLYSQETTRFAIQLGVSVAHAELKKVGPLNRGIQDEWCNSNTDILYGNALLNALQNGSSFIKPRWQVNGIEPFVVDAGNMGVLREDSPMLSSQEAFTHDYYITQSDLADQLESHPRRLSILQQVVSGPKQSTSAITPLDRIITSSSLPIVQGNVDLNLSLTTRYAPAVSEPLVAMTELYVFDSEIKDFRVVTLADPYVLVYDRSLDYMFLKNDPPFVQICPLPSHDYFWGLSEIERLVAIQELLNQRWDQIRHLQELQARPPKNFSGFEGITDEIAAAFDSPNGQVNSPIPGAKVDNMAPQIPADLFKDIDYLESKFEDASGINNVMSGKGESGVRSSGHASQLARLGSSRVKKRAMVVEDSIEKLATMYLKIKQKYDKRRYREDDEKGVQFIADQFTEDFVVKVDGHSNSPIFVEDQTQLAFELFKNKVITRERLLELISVPMREQLISDVREVIEPAEQAAHEQEHQDKVRSIDAKRSGRHG